MKCTWKDCPNEATEPQIGKDGSQWADLCKAHEKELMDAIKSGNARMVLRSWARAQVDISEAEL